MTPADCADSDICDHDKSLCDLEIEEEFLASRQEFSRTHSLGHYYESDAEWFFQAGYKAAKATKEVKS